MSLSFSSVSQFLPLWFYYSLNLPGLFLLFYICFLFFKYSGLHFSPHHSLPPQQSLPPTLDSSTLWLFPCVLYKCSLTTLPLFTPIIPSHLTSGYCQFFFLFQCLQVYFTSLLVLLIRFHLYVKSYSICRSPTGLFHVEKCSPDLFMPLQMVGANSSFCRVVLFHCVNVPDFFHAFFNLLLFKYSFLHLPPITQTTPAIHISLSWL